MTDESAEDEKKFRDPELAINRVYTRKGDAGTTKLVGGQMVDKDSARIAAYGTVDELNAFVGAARVELLDHARGGQRPSTSTEPPSAGDLSKALLRVQHELFNLGSILATLPEDVGESMPRVDAEDIEALEESIDVYNGDLPSLRSFVLPGSSRLNVALHQCRTICRRAERAVVALSRSDDVDEQAVAYLNRLSDAFFVWSRFAAVESGEGEILWDPNQT